MPFRAATFTWCLWQNITPGGIVLLKAMFLWGSTVGPHSMWKAGCRHGPAKAGDSSTQLKNSPDRLRSTDRVGSVAELPICAALLPAKGAPPVPGGMGCGPAMKTTCPSGSSPVTANASPGWTPVASRTPRQGLFLTRHMPSRLGLPISGPENPVRLVALAASNRCKHAIVLPGLARVGPASSGIVTAKSDFLLNFKWMRSLARSWLHTHRQLLALDQGTPRF